MTSPENRRLTIGVERFALKNPFVIARGAKTEAVVVTATIIRAHGRTRRMHALCALWRERRKRERGDRIGPRRDRGGRRPRRAARPAAAGAARNALDCALWDLDAKISGVPAFQLAGLHQIAPCVTAYTLSVGTPDEMARAARAASDRPVLKVKLAGAGDAERLAAVRAAAPEAELIVDANEAWRPDTLDENFAACAAAGVSLVEQPLPAAPTRRWPHGAGPSRSAPTRASTTARGSRPCAGATT